MTRRNLLFQFLAPAGAAYSECRKVEKFPNYEVDEFAAWGYKKCVYSSGRSDLHHAAVLVLHEINGLTEKGFELAERLRGAGFSVYLPLLFGHAGQDNKLGFFACAGSEFNCKAWHSSGQIVNWVAALAESIGKRHKRLGVIGNCLTGSMPLALMADGKVRPHLKCAVISQPALPMLPISKHAREALAMTDAQLKAAVKSEIPVLAYRFTTDAIVPEERMHSLENWFKETGKLKFQPWDPNPEHCGTPHFPTKGHEHAVLTSGYCSDPKSSGYKAYQMLESFLKEHLADRKVTS